MPNAVMSYQVLARKWRPQNFEDIVGQDAAAETLKNAISQNRIAHAYLFAGVRGVGKTTTARILAKALNCQEGPTETPCNDCASCREITLGQSIDVLEIDAASNRGIDEIRELRASVRYAAARDRYKVFIIDEVHMLTTEAFNALLKTLEEPPPHVVFILATTELHKVPSTILSRCQHFNFRAISYGEILERLAIIASQEQIEIGERSLSAIARASEGSMRDAQSVLDQVISLCGREVDHEQVRNLLGIVPQQLLEDVTTAINDSDTKQVLVLVDQLLTSGRSPQEFVRELLSHFRNLLMVKIIGKDSQLVGVSPGDLESLEVLSTHFSEEDLTRFFQLLVATDGELRWSVHPRLHLEIGLVRIIQAKRLVAMEELLAVLPKADNTENLRQRIVPSETIGPLPPSRLVPNGSNSPSPGEKSEEGDKIKQALTEVSPMLASILEHALDLSIDANEFRIRFSSTDRFYYDYPPGMCCKWFGKDNAMTYTAFDYHKKLTEQEGFDPNSTEYYAEIDKRMRLDFPHKFDNTKSQESTNRTQIVASAKRSVHPGRKTVRLTSSQVAIAKKLGVPLEEYAKQLKITKEA